MMRDSLGVPIEPECEPHIHIANDWLDEPIYSDDNDEYFLIDDEYVLDDPEHLRSYLLKHGVLLTTMQIYDNQNKEGYDG